MSALDISTTSAAKNMNSRSLASCHQGLSNGDLVW